MTLPSPPLHDPSLQRGTACRCVPVAPRIEAQQADVLVAQLKALAHPVRLRMLELISAHGCGLCVCEFEQHFDLTQPTISHHLKLLREAGLIRSRQEGPWVHHFAEPAALDQLRQVLDQFAGGARAASSTPGCS